MIKKFKERVSEKQINIGIGLGASEYQNKKILQASLNFVELNKANIYIFGNSKFTKILHGLIPKNYINSRINLIDCQTPEQVILDSLVDKTIHSIVRGSISSNKFIKILKEKLNVIETNRLALLETTNGQQFFFGPVGIDECSITEKKINYIDLAIKTLQKFDIIPKISILSGGRTSDIGRSSKVDNTIQEANKIVELLKKRFTHLEISHDEILIEKAIEGNSNLIIAPDGISGNLIYRTLVHLGGGKAYGAIYMGLRDLIIDTSRVGELSEIQGALSLALALSN